MGPAVLLLSHGSRDPRAAFVVGELVAAVRRRTRVEVRACHLDFTEPTPDVALQDLATGGHDDIRL
ncbi:MAG: sirohydrochlorin chelatase, partial [Oryzihumus sp.]